MNSNVPQSNSTEEVILDNLLDRAVAQMFDLPLPPKLGDLPDGHMGFIARYPVPSSVFSPLDKLSV